MPVLTHDTRIACILSLLVIFSCSAHRSESPPAAPGPPPAISLEPLLGGFSLPVGLEQAGDGSNRIFIVEQAGLIRIIRNHAILPSPFLDIAGLVSCCGEQGLLGLAFPPGFAAKQYFYVNYTDTAGDTVIARYRVSPDDPDTALPGSAEVVLTVDQPFANHNGGRLAFGPDGFLYIGLGDGGSGGDPFGNGQNPGALLGKMLRIDVEGAVAPFGIPPDNPFSGNADFRPEIWATGLRNPWRYSFDTLTGDLYIADVGESLREEVNFQPASSRGGENYGWNIMEGVSCFGTNTCDQTGLTLPVVDYDHGLGCTVIGGHVYRGPQFPSLQGFYLYGDFCSGRIWGLRNAGGSWENFLLLDSDIAITTFGLDEAGELYIADYAGGQIYRVIVQ